MTRAVCHRIELSIVGEPHSCLLCSKVESPPFPTGESRIPESQGPLHSDLCLGRAHICTGLPLEAMGILSIAEHNIFDPTKRETSPGISPVFLFSIVIGRFVKSCGLYMHMCECVYSQGLAPSPLREALTEPGAKLVASQ